MAGYDVTSVSGGSEYGGVNKPQQKQQETNAKPSVFLENQDNNGTVEKSDIVLSGEKPTSGFASAIYNKINALIQRNEGKEWTTDLKNQINRLIKSFNDEVNKPEESFEDFSNKVSEDFDNFGQEVNKDYSEFNEEVHDSTTQARLEYMKSVLADLKKEGYYGELSITGFGVISYNRESGTYVVTNEEGKTKPFPKEAFDEILGLIADDHGFEILGSAKFKKVKMGI